jgi:hypothetical protein
LHCWRQNGQVVSFSTPYQFPLVRMFCSGLSLPYGTRHLPKLGNHAQCNAHFIGCSG